MNKVKYTEWIDSYLEGELDDAGRKKFEGELLINRELAMEFKMEQDLQEVLADEDLIDFRAKCVEAQNDYNLSTRQLARVVQFTRKYWYAVASLFLIALVTGSLVLFNPGSYSSERLFKMYYKSGEAVGVSRTGNANIAEALLLFSQKDFEAAEGQFDEILVNDPENFAVKYYSGISNLELKNFDKASMMFESILANGQNLYVENAKWYLGLTYLVTNKSHDAVSIFEQIAANPQHHHQKDASSLLEKLKKAEKNKRFLNNLFFLILPF